ncbi:MAG: Fpg/Nei family DNA glycosylase, partial [Actinomycetia bacterium]|nr:Fpg/Nei family DNA glycosylase [Actinomycetes bacterium]
GYADLVGATICRVLEPTGVAALDAQLGPDPLDPQADPEPFYAAAAATSRPIGAVLMDQKAVAGIGNIFRAESLFRAGQHPHTPAARVPRERLELLWRDNVTLMEAAVRLGRIVTTAPEHRPGVPAERAWREHANYVYLRHGRPCRVCGKDAIIVEDLGGRKLYWCTVCQAPR